MLYRRLLGGAIILSMLISTATPTQAIDFDSYYTLTQLNSPVLKNSELEKKISNESLNETRGIHDWALSIAPTLSQSNNIQSSSFTPSQTTSTIIYTAATKKIKLTGGQLSIYEQSSKIDQSDVLLGGIPINNPEFFQHQLGVEYKHPLLKNAFGAIDNTPYDIASINAKNADIIYLNQKEDHLYTTINEFLDWTSTYENYQLAKDQHAIAIEQFQQSKRKYKKNLIEKVDLLIAEDALRNAEQSMLESKSQFNAKTSELAIKHQNNTLLEETPNQKLTPLTIQLAPVSEKEFDKLHVIASLHNSYDSINRQYEQSINAKKPSLDLSLKAEMAGGNTTLSDSLSLDKPNSSISINYLQILGNKTATATEKSLSYQKEILKNTIDTTKRQLQSQLSSIEIQYKELQDIIRLNTAQIKSSNRRIREEQKRYNQGRGQLTWVIQARNNEKNAKRRYIQNSIRSYKLLYLHLSLTDQLLAEFEGKKS